MEGNLKFPALFLLINILACSSLRSPPSGPNVFAMAFDSAADDAIRVTALKRMEEEGVCFDISMVFKHENDPTANPSSWTFAWVDSTKKSHPLSLNRRDPASVPVKSQDEWKNNFTTCAPNVSFRDVTALVLTPKEIPHVRNEELHLNWQR